jgi:uncharacterized protein (DUF1015 family)
VPEIQPFPGIRYERDGAELARVLAPPYDVISPPQRDALYDRDPHNVVRLVLNRTPGEAGYAEAGDTLEAWLEGGVLKRETTPSLYLLEQTFDDPESGQALRRMGLLARFRAEDPERRIVLPHEQTRTAAKEDRWRLLQTTRVNFSPIFLMVPDPTGRFPTLAAEAISRSPLLTFTDDADVAHRLWRLDDPEGIGEWQSTLASTPAYIADGHHRHATALRWRDEHGPDGAWTLGCFTPLDDPGLRVLPYHRILAEGPSLEEATRRLEGHFSVSRAPNPASAAEAVGRSRARWVFALAEPGHGAVVAEAKASAESLLPQDAEACLRALDAYLLHHGVLGPLLGIPDSAVSYVHSLGEAVEAVAREECRMAALLRGTPVQQIVDVADAGESMPAKTTFFHPKLPSGLVIHPLV